MARWDEPGMRASNIEFQMLEIARNAAGRSSELTFSANNYKININNWTMQVIAKMKLRRRRKKAEAERNIQSELVCLSVPHITSCNQQIIQFDTTRIVTIRIRKRKV